MSPPQPARGARSRACAICALLAGAAGRSRCRRRRRCSPPSSTASPSPPGARRRCRSRSRRRSRASPASRSRRRINATDAEDALKYLPSLTVRKRYIGDYDHAVLATRASGTGNSARSLVYADGILLSNLLGNGAGFTPRWGLVAPEEIERVDVLYGPFSAAYSGNSAGAIVDFVTRMPTPLRGARQAAGLRPAAIGCTGPTTPTAAARGAPRSAAAPARSRGGSR